MRFGLAIILRQLLKSRRECFLTEIYLLLFRNRCSYPDTIYHYAVPKSTMYGTLAEFRPEHLLQALRRRNYVAVNALTGPHGAVGRGFNFKADSSISYYITAYPYVTVTPGADLAQRILAASGPVDLMEIVPFLQNLDPAVSSCNYAKLIGKPLV